MFTLEEFQKDWWDRLGGDHMYRSSYKWLAEKLGPLNEMNVLETSTSGHPSTQIFDWMFQRTKGSCISIEADPKNYADQKAMCHRVTIVRAEPLDFLGTIRRLDAIKKLTLLLLNSQQSDDKLTSFYRCAELAMVWRFIKPGCMIATDHCFHYKLHELKKFFGELGIEPVHEDHITVWIKP